METAYDRLIYAPSELRHEYGSKVHILAHPSLVTRLARVCSPECGTPEMQRLVRDLYRELASIVAGAEFPRKRVRSRTRMRADYVGEILDPSTRVVCVDITRAGIVPSLACHEMFASLVDAAGVRQDHVFMNRRTDGDGRVVGVDLSGSKIGGRIGGAIVVVPDPMGATGSSTCAALDLYAARKLGRARKFVALHLIVTPEYLRRLRDEHPEISVYAIRLDRGLSGRRVLRRRPGELWEKERGLNERHYIVPGGGGFGELLNNAEA